MPRQVFSVTLFSSSTVEKRKAQTLKNVQKKTQTIDYITRRTGF
ncbi:MAG: hypothetical protein RIR11_3209 [Bacteroidota bacterium]|jgi:hypothetical protein